MRSDDGIITRGLLIDGQEVEAADGGTLTVINPADGQAIAQVAAAGIADVDAAVTVARETFQVGTWSEMPIWERARELHRLADAIEDRIEDLVRLETFNNGRPITETRAQVSRLPGWYRYNASLLLADRGHVIPMPGPYHTYTSRFP
ncbi:MAG: aldehyde dehydrogenase family protein, partial [Acidimicrobiia bacterium]